MNFNYSYRAFLLTSLLFGILFLTLWSIRLSSEIVDEQEFVPITYEENLSEEEMLTAEVSQTEITTNQAYNEAEEFIKKAESERFKDQTITQEAQAQNDEIPQGNPATQEAILEAKKRVDAIKSKTINTISKSEKKLSSKEVNTKTTIRYSLKNRTPLALPNPVYTCEGGGKVVISIEVNELGKIVRASYNKQASTTSNGCLIESALAYAENARFTTKAGVKTQKGTITYIFPGQ